MWSISRSKHPGLPAEWLQHRYWPSKDRGNWTLKVNRIYRYVPFPSNESSLLNFSSCSKACSWDLLYETEKSPATTWKESRRKKYPPLFPSRFVLFYGTDLLGRKQRKGKLSKVVYRIFRSGKTKYEPVYYVPGDVLPGQFIMEHLFINDKEFKWEETRTRNTP